MTLEEVYELFEGLTDPQKVSLLAELTHRLTILARGTYPAEEQRTEAERQLISYNESLHRISGHLMHLQNGSKRVPDDLVLQSLLEPDRPGFAGRAALLWDLLERHRKSQPQQPKEEVALAADDCTPMPRAREPSWKASVQMHATLPSPLAAFFRERVLPWLAVNDCVRVEAHRDVPTDCYTLSIDAEVAETVVDICLSLLMKGGLADNWEPNPEGAVLEELIDRFNPQV